MALPHVQVNSNPRQTVILQILSQILEGDEIVTDTSIRPIKNVKNGVKVHDTLWTFGEQVTI